MLPFLLQRRLSFFLRRHTPHPQKVNAEAVILGNDIIGPLFLEEILTPNFTIAE